MEVSIKIYEENSEGRDFIIGDLHGMYSLLMEKIEEVKFDKEKDRLFSVGDLVDRGPSSFRSSSLIEEDWFYCVMGNHEDMFLQWYNDRTPDLTRWYFGNGGGWVKEYEEDSLKFVAKRFESLPHVILIGEDKPVVITHAEFPFTSLSQFYEDVLENPQNVIERILWSRTKISYRYDWVCEGIKQSYHGHTPLKEVTHLGNSTFIDTGAFYQEDPFDLTLMEIE